jgi:hypothetical protein
MKWLIGDHEEICVHRALLRGGSGLLPNAESVCVALLGGAATSGYVIVFVESASAWGNLSRSCRLAEAAGLLSRYGSL